HGRALPAICAGGGCVHPDDVLLQHVLPGHVAGGDFRHAPDGQARRNDLPPAGAALAVPEQGAQSPPARRRVDLLPEQLPQGLAGFAREGLTTMPVADMSISEFIPLSSHVANNVVKTTGGDFLLTWRLDGLPFVGREEWDLEHRHNTFNRMLQTLRAPDFVNVAFWVHDVRRKGRIRMGGKYAQAFNQQLSDEYYQALSGQKIMQNQLYLTMLYRPVVAGKRFVERSTGIARLQAEQDHAVAKLLELAGNLEAVLRDHAPVRLGMYEGANGVVFSETLEIFGYLLNRINEPVPVLRAPACDYLPVSRHTFSARSGDFVVTTPAGENRFGAILNIKEYADSTWPGVLNGLKYLDFEYVITHSFSPMGRQDALK